MPIQLSKTVGLKALGQTPLDVKTIQTMLNNLKDKRNRPFYQGRIDGKCGPKTLFAIEECQGCYNIRPTGRIEPNSTTFKRMCQKLPRPVMVKLEEQQEKTKSNNSCSSSSNSSTSDQQNDVPPQASGNIYNASAIVASNKKLARDIVQTWPLPKKEAIELARLVERAGGDTPIPLKDFGKLTVKIEDDGGFRVKFSIPPQFYQHNTYFSAALVEKVNESFAGSSIWQVGSKDNLLFYSSIKHSVFARIGNLSAEDKKAIKLPANASLVQEQCAAAAVKVIKEKTELDEETLSDVIGTSKALADALFDVWSRNKDKMTKLLVKFGNKKFDLILIEGKLLLKGEEQDKKIIIGEISSLLANWALTAVGRSVAIATAGLVGVTAVSSLAVISAVTGLAITAWYIWGGGDEWVNKNAPKLFEHIKDGSYMDYLEKLNVLTVLKKRVIDWEIEMKANMANFLSPEVKTAYMNYLAKRSLDQLSSVSDGFDLLDVIIKWLFDNAGIRYKRLE